MDSSSAESDSMSDYEMNESPPPAVIDADEEEIMSDPQNTMNIQDPKMKGQVILDAIPLRVVPYGGITFDKEKVGLLRNQSVPIQALSIRDRKQEDVFPLPLQLHGAYKEGDWKAFIDRGVHGRRKDRSYKHREYRRNFRSKLEVKEFLDTNGPVTGMFKGRKLHKNKAGLHGHGCIVGTSKSTRGRNTAKYEVEKVGLLRNQTVPVQALSIWVRKQEDEFPLPLQLHKAYKKGDWKAFIDRGVHGCRKDRTYKHKEYRRNFRSKLEVKEFLDTNGPVTGMFKGRKLHKDKSGLDGHGSVGTSKSTRGRKTAKYPRVKVSVASGPSIWPYSSHGFV